MANLRILATEEMVGHGHGTKADTLNRAYNIEHEEDGTHNNITQSDGQSVTTDKIEARDGDGLALQDDGGNGPFIADGGSMVNTVQPAFLTKNAAVQADVTGDGTAWIVPFGTEVFDQGGDFATPNFTAPVDGRYRLTASVYLTGLAAAHNDHVIRLITSNRIYDVRDLFGAGANPFITERNLKLTVLADMDAADTVYVEVDITGGAKTVDFYGDVSGVEYTFFCGELVT